MCRSERIPVAILGLLMIFALLAAPTCVFARGPMIADDDYHSGMEPGDPEGGDRIFDDTPFSGPSGQTRYIGEDPIGGGRSIGEIEILVIPFLRDALIIIKTPDRVNLHSILLSR